MLNREKLLELHSDFIGRNKEDDDLDSESLIVDILEQVLKELDDLVGHTHNIY